MEIEGEFKNNKPDGKCIMTKYNYRFEGCYENGVKKGSGEEECRDYDNSFKYKGEYDNDKFETWKLLNCQVLLFLIIKLQH